MTGNRDHNDVRAETGSRFAELEDELGRAVAEATRVSVGLSVVTELGRLLTLRDEPGQE